MLVNGYIKLQRSLKEWRWYQDGNTLRLWIHLLLSANCEACAFRDIEVARGELVTSLKRLSDDTGMSVKEIRTSLEKLKKTGEIAVSSNRRYSLIRVLKFEDYQSPSGEQSASEGQSEGTQGAHQGQTDGIPRANNGQSSGTQGATMEEVGGGGELYINNNINNINNNSRKQSSTTPLPPPESPRQAGGTVQPCPAEAKELCAYFEENCHVFNSRPVLDAIIRCLLDGIAPEVLKAAIDDTALANANAPAKYVVKIMNDILAENVRELSSYRARQERRKGGRAQAPTAAPRYGGYDDEGEESL